jgi:hypothetical protein
MEDLMDLIGQLQERYGITQPDVDTLVDAINQTFVGGDEVGNAMSDQSVPEFEPEDEEEY